MAISLVNTVGAATANTYVGLTAAQAFIGGLVGNGGMLAWASSTTGQKTNFLVLLKVLETVFGCRTNDRTGIGMAKIRC